MRERERWQHEQERIEEEKNNIRDMQTQLISRESSIAIQETYGDKTAAYKLKLDSGEVVNIFFTFIHVINQAYGK